MVLMANRYIMPAALEYLNESGRASPLSEAQEDRQRKARSCWVNTWLVDRFKTEADKLESLLDHNGGSAEKHAKYA